MASEYPSEFISAVEAPTFDPDKPLPPLPSGLCEESAHRGMAQFQEIMRQQLEGSMQAELQKLLGTASGSEKEVRLLRLSLHPRLSVAHYIWL